MTESALLPPEVDPVRTFSVFVAEWKPDVGLDDATMRETWAIINRRHGRGDTPMPEYVRDWNEL